MTDDNRVYLDGFENAIVLKRNEKYDKTVVKVRDEERRPKSRKTGEESYAGDISESQLYTLPDKGTMGEVGHILMDVDSGDMVLDKSTKIEELERNAERLYQEKTLSAGE